MIYESLSSPTDTNIYLKGYSNLSADTFKDLINAFRESGVKKEKAATSGGKQETNGFEERRSIHKSAYISGRLSHPDKPSPIDYESVKNFKPANLSENSLLYYADPIKQGTITPDQMGKFNALALDSIINYPDIFTYDELTRTRIASSVFRKIGAVNYDLPYEEMYKVYKTISSSKDDPKTLIKKFVNRKLIDVNQSEYLLQAYDVLSMGTKSANETAEINMNMINTGLNALADRAQNDRTLSEDQSFTLASLMKIMSSTIDYVNNISVLNRVTCCCCEEKPHRAEKKSPCYRCINNYIGFVLAGVLLAALMLLVLLTAPVTIPLAVIIVAGTVPVAAGLLEVIIGKCAIECGLNVVPDTPTPPPPDPGVIALCPQCPSNTYFFDGANCYMGWYHSNHMGWVYGDAFWYYGDTVFGCADGNLNSSWGYAGFATGGHGIPSGGGSCLFGYVYSALPGNSWTPWVAPTGFYIKPYCKK